MQCTEKLKRRDIFSCQCWIPLLSTGSGLYKSELTLKTDEREKFKIRAISSVDAGAGPAWSHAGLDFWSFSLGFHNAAVQRELNKCARSTNNRQRRWYISRYIAVLFEVGLPYLIAPDTALVFMVASQNNSIRTELSTNLIQAAVEEAADVLHEI